MAVALLLLVALAARINEIAAKFYPADLVAEYPERRETQAVELPRSHLIVAAYGNTLSSQIAVISERDGGALLMRRDLVSPGRLTSIELRDLDRDRQPEIVVHLAEPRGGDVVSVFRWDGKNLLMIGPRRQWPGNPGVEATALTDPSFIDIDGDGVYEIVDEKYFRMTDDNGEEHSGAERTLYRLTDTDPHGGKILDDFDLFTGGSDPAELFTGDFDVDDPGPNRELVVVNGSAANGKRVASATVDVNGVRVVNRTDLVRTPARVRVPVHLKSGTNTIAVNVLGAPDAEIAILIGPAPLAGRK